MKLILQNGYPYPFPEGFDVEKEGYDCREFSVEIEGVIHFEWKYELTIEFKTYAQAKQYSEQLGWPFWTDDRSLAILSAPYSEADGYEAPAIIVGDKAYCGFILMEG